MIGGDSESLVRVLLLPLTALIWLTLLLSLLALLGLLCRALGLVALRGRLHLAFASLAVEDSTDCLLAGGEVGCHIEQLVRTGRRVPSQLAHEIPAHCAQMKGTNDFGVGDAGELGALLGEASHVVTQGFAGLLTTPFEVPGVPRAHLSLIHI